MKKYVCILMLGLFSVFTLAQDEKEQAVRELMDLMGVRNQYVSFAKNYIELIKSQYGHLDDEFFDSIEEVFIEEVEVAYEMILPIYMKHLELETIKGVNEFYRSQAGEKLLEVQPTIMQESMQAGAEWGESLQEKFLEKIRALEKDE